MGKADLAKLGLGTVQFGLDYGITNTDGKTSPEEVKSILSYAIKSGIVTLDTAHLYGDSEQVLGNTITRDQDFQIITKSIPVKKSEISITDVEMVKRGFELSITRLNQRKISGFLLHHANDLISLNAEMLYNFLCEMKNSGIVEKIGVSVYNKQQIDLVLGNYDIDLIQIPMNIFDQRLIQSGTIRELKKRNIEIHVRSAFLQGIIFLPLKSLPDSIHGFTPALSSLIEYSAEIKKTPAQVALSFLTQQSEVDKIICGVNSLQQLQELVETMSCLPIVDQNDFDVFAVNDEALLNPTNW